ncbi:MAG: extracellular solute-binding protein [Bauldia sp.]|nr:extracellular solute-binding protein [Bauldia sp.]
MPEPVRRRSLRDSAPRYVARGPLPEGPYETVQGARTNVVLGEAQAVLDFADYVEATAEPFLGLKRGYSEMQMVIYLIRCHMAGRLVTSSALASASGMPFATAMRGIQAMSRRGLIVKRPRTASGKSFSLHPSVELLNAWQGYAARLREAMQTSQVGHPPAAKPAGAIIRDSSPGTIPPPPVLEAKLNLGREIRFLVHADPTFTAMNALRKQFEMMFGVAIRSRALSIDRLRAEVINNGRLSTSKHDIIACDLPWFGELAHRGLLFPLDRLIDSLEFDCSDFHPDAMASARYRGVQYGVPIITTAETLVYRTDLFAKAGIDPPTTSAETLAAACALTKPEIGQYGIAWTGGRGTAIGHTFIMIMSAFGQCVVNLRKTRDGFDAESFEGENLRPMFLSEAAFETAYYLSELLQYSPPNILEMNWYERAMAYAKGTAACAYSHSLLAPLYELDETSPAYRRTGYLPHPIGPRGSRIVPLGGYALAIPANIEPSRIEDVAIALRALTSPGAAKLYAMNGSLAFSRFSLINDPEVRGISPMMSAIEDLAGRGLLRMWPRPPVPEVSGVIAIAGEEIHDMLSGGKTIQEALSNAQNRSDQMMRGAGHY